jgi:hypothetical protein
MCHSIISPFNALSMEWHAASNSSIPSPHQVSGQRQGNYGIWSLTHNSATCTPGCWGRHGPIHDRRLGDSRVPGRSWLKMQVPKQKGHFSFAVKWSALSSMCSNWNIEAGRYGWEHSLTLHIMQTTPHSRTKHPNGPVAFRGSSRKPAEHPNGIFIILTHSQVQQPCSLACHFALRCFCPFDKLTACIPSMQCTLSAG